MAEKSADLERIRRQLRKMAFGKNNDCAKLALQADVDIDRLDLSLLTEIRRSEKGGVEVKLLDRTRVLEQLAQMAEAEDDQAAEILRAILEGEKRHGVFPEAEENHDMVASDEPGQPV